MNDSLLKTALAAALLLASLPATSQEVAEDMWIATCSENSRLVYRERMTATDAANRQSSIVRRYPDATCIFLAETGSTPSLSLADVVSMEPGTAIGDESLEAALLAITGQVPMMPGEPVPQPPPAASIPEPNDGFVAVVTPPRNAPAPGWVRLSTYLTDDLDDVLADWDRLVAAYPAASDFTPATISTDDGYILLSAGPMTSAESWDLCLAAQASLMDCEPIPASPEELGVSFLQHAFPLAFAFGEDVCALHREGDGRMARNACWRSAFLTPARLPSLGSRSTSPNVLATAGEGYPPLPRPRPVNGAEQPLGMASAR